MSIVLELPRVTRTGNPPRILVTSELLQRLDLPRAENVTSLGLLKTLYIDQHRSAANIGVIFGVQSKTVTNWLERLEIPKRSQGDAVSLAISRHANSPFSGNLEERAYLLGMRAGDLHAQNHGRRIRVSVGTTHPSMIELFTSLFERYGAVRRYPKFSEVSGYHWCIYVDLEQTFDFILRKPDRLPEWILSDEVLFISFLSGYFDAEGCISFDLRSRQRSIAWIICSCDFEILRQIRTKMQALGYGVSMGLAKGAGELDLRANFWRIRMGNREDVLKLLSRAELRHPEKVRLARLLRIISESGWKSGWEDARRQRLQIKAGVRLCVLEAETQLMRFTR